MRVRVFIVVVAILGIVQGGFAQELVIIRHGEADHNLSKVYSSRVSTQPPSALTEAGQKQVTASAQRLREQGMGGSKVEGIYVSPLLRTRQTAEILVRELQVQEEKVHIEPALIEPDMGRLEGKTVAETQSYFPKGDDWDKSEAKKYGGETNDDVERRLRGFLKKLCARRTHSPIILVSHGSPSSMLLTLLEGPQSKDQRLKNADYRVVRLDPFCAK